MTRYNRFTAQLVFCLALLVIPTGAMAQDEEVIPDARLLGFEGSPVNLEGNASLNYIILLGMSIVGVSVLFINAKRSHLD